ncbi:MAG: hypothetical protein HY875_02535 [Chloroflexi bacterium]|nr:hypothetical protein [Chloroflexota bacterium]
MCTYIVEKTGISGSGKGAGGWFSVDHAYVSYDHPFHVQLEHALNIDFVNEASGLDARVAVELTRESARSLAATILQALERADAHEAAAESPAG